MTDSSSKYYKTSIRVITFSGKKKDWIAWEEKFFAKSKRRGYKDVLLGKITIPKSTENLDPADPDEEKLIAIQELNESGYTDLILSMDTEKSSGKVAFNIVRNSKSKDYEDGNIEVAFKNLRRKYALQNAPSLAKLHKSFYGASLKKNIDPDVFITYLEDIRSRMEDMKSQMTDDQFILHVVNNLTDDYMNQVKSLERRIGAPTNPTDIEDVREELNLKFERLKSRNKSNSDDEEEEHAMFADGNKSRSKCNHCGKFGHKSADCFSKGKSEKAEGQSGGGGNGQPTAVKAKFTGDCFNCKLAGHRAADCRKKKRDLAAGQPDQGIVTVGGTPKVSFPELIALMAYEDDSETKDTPDRFYVKCGVCSQDKEDTMLILGQHRCADCREDRRRLDLFLADVARKKGIQVGHVQSWSQAVRVKLAKIDLRSVSDVTACVRIINGKLPAAHQKEMHNYSLEVIAREGVRNIEKHYRALLRVF
jgi:hypothetical protein